MFLLLFTLPFPYTLYGKIRGEKISLGEDYQRNNTYLSFHGVEAGQPLANANGEDDGYWK